MKLKEYFRLGRISLKARKKTTRQTVRGLSFGAILLLPVVFLGLSFYIDVNAQVDKDPEIRTFFVPVSQQLFSTNDVRGLYQEYVPEIIKNASYDKYYQTRTYYFDTGYEIGDLEQKSTTVTINDVSVALPYLSTERSGSGYATKQKAIQFITTNDSCQDNIFFNFDYNYSKTPLIAGSGFSKDSSRGEILISNRFLTKEYGSFTTDIIGKKISVRTLINGTTRHVTCSDKKGTISGTDYFSNLISSHQPYEMFTDFTIKGIFDENIYNSSPRLNSLGTTYNEKTKSPNITPLFICTNDSLYNNSGKSYLPEVDVTLDSSGKLSELYVYHSSKVSEAAANAKQDGLVYIPLGVGGSCSRIEKMSAIEYAVDSTLLLNSKSYKEANQNEALLKTYFDKSSIAAGTHQTYVSYSTGTYNTFSLLYKVFLYMILVMAIFGGIIFFATCLNLYNTIHYSVVSRTNYLGILRAMGLRGQDVTKQYFVENSLIFGRTLIWTTAIGGAICVGVKFIMDFALKQAGINTVKSFGISLSLNLAYLPLALAIILAVFLLVDVLCSFIACYRVSSSPLLDLLSEDK